ncbi:MAG: DUF364 domain-containing protein [Candidatus Edwardsbacteria bacterium]|nr:DUF364 domain-containing protein [Candidatus Edwardsbacteria bacterium]
MNGPAAIELFREKLRAVVDSHALNDAEVLVTVKPLTPQEAIGDPLRRDYPIIEGKERVIEAEVSGSRGQAFTDSPVNYMGRLDEVMSMALTAASDRAIFLAVSNAVLERLGIVEGTTHCKDESPELCATEIAASARRLGIRTIGLIGLNPAIADALIQEFGTINVLMTDLNPNSIGRQRSGVRIWDGRAKTAELIRSSDLIIATGTTLVNGTYDEIMHLTSSAGKRLVLYGITAAGFCGLMGRERWCFRDQ